MLDTVRAIQTDASVTVGIYGRGGRQTQQGVVETVCDEHRGHDVT